MKIVHVASFNYLKDGQSYYATDYKIQQGLIRNGHFVYPFSYRDTARCGNIFGSKRWGIGKTNRRLIETCKNIAPDLLLLSHAELISGETLERIRLLLPNIKIAMWFVDPLWIQHHCLNIQSKIDSLDVFFATTSGTPLKAFKRPRNRVAYFPNIADASIETAQCFAHSDLSIDFLFCGRDYKEPERQAFLVELEKSLSFCNAQFFGCLGKPLIFGDAYTSQLSQAKMGLSYNRRNDVDLYMSDRIVQLTGNGILTFSPKVPDMELLYTHEEVVYFDSAEELHAKLRYFHTHDQERRNIARKGWGKTHRSFNGERITRYMIETIFDRPLSENYEWQNERF